MQQTLNSPCDIGGSTVIKLREIFCAQRKHIVDIVIQFLLNGALLSIRAKTQHQCLFFSLVLQQSVFKPHQVSLRIKRKNFDVG